MPKSRYLPLALLLALPLLLSGCQVAGIDVSLTPATPVPSHAASLGTAVPAQRTAAAAPTPAFDLQAGNCPEAAEQAIESIAFAAQRGANLDARLELSPVTVGCGGAADALATYRARVTSASLTMFVIDGTWPNLFLASRSALLRDLMGRLHRLYPAAICKVLVYQGDSVLGSVTLGTDNNPQVSCCSG